MSVSRTWRSTILLFPSLWSVAYLNGEISPGYIRMLLQRSGGHPLDVTIPREYFRSGPKFNRYSHALDVSAHTSRIRKLHFWLYPNEGRNDVKHVVKVLSKKPAPNLTHLKLVAFLPHPPTSFPNLFGLEFPKLRVLKVAGVEAWPEIVGANLTRITINSSLDPRVLKQCVPYSPNLKVLKIQGVWDLKEPDLTTWRRIALPPSICLVVQYSTMCPRVLALFSLARDGHLKISPWRYTTSNEPLLPTEISHLHNLHTLTRLHIKVHVHTRVTLELKCFRFDQPAFDINLEYSTSEGQTIDQRNVSRIMWFLYHLHRIVFSGVEELRMEGFIGSLELQETQLLAFLERMPALTRLITTDSNEEAIRSALDSLGCRAVVIRVEQ
jgi:hypothetical protein